MFIGVHARVFTVEQMDTYSKVGIRISDVLFTKYHIKRGKNTINVTSSCVGTNLISQKDYMIMGHFSGIHPRQLVIYTYIC